MYLVFMAKDPQHDRLLAIVKSLPGAYEDYPWGSLHCKVDGKIFVGWGRDDDGIMSLGLRTDLDKQAALVKSDPRFSIAAYSGKYGGIDFRIGKNPDWAEVEHFIVESYRAVAPKKRLKELDAQLAGGSTKPPPAKPAAKRPASKKKPATRRR
jgi:predicted DNA-binding protein (MmcQ/YjbR family)